MANKNETLALSLTLLITLSLAGGGVWYYSKSLGEKANSPSQSPPVPSSPNPSNPVPSAPGIPNLAAEPLSLIAVSLPSPPVLEMDGSVTMVRPIKRLQNLFAQRFPNQATAYGIPDNKPNGSNRGLQALIDQKIQMAASSRPLKAAELQAELVAIPIAKDALAVVVGVDNPFQGNLTTAQLTGIFEAKITNWQEVGGPNRPIRVINRAKDSGTHSLFQSIVLEDRPFPSDRTNFLTWPTDQTTAIFRQLGSDGISYTTVSQAVGQKTIRVLPINDISPTNVAAIKSGEYLLARNVFLVTRRQISQAAKDFIELALSPPGQKALEETGFIALQ
ncbi:MAG: phosphate ABC transporter substrate-binding protein [Pseudanabaenaceae cyanobacterium bins.68]|nr:phosphate ABC transporter substrate-binding protein [Pseudanabaenaceae cyanobacterium bins.68]